MVIAINLTAIIISSLALLVALAALAMVIGMKLSTHRIEFKPLETPELFSEEEEESAEKEDDDFLQKAYDLQRKKKPKLEDPLEDITQTSNF